MRVLNAASVVMMVLGAIGNVVAQPIALSSIEARAVDPELTALAKVGLDHRKATGATGQPGIHFPAKLANGETIIGKSQGGGFHAEDDAIAQAQAKGTHIVKGVPVGVDDKFPKENDHVAKVCDKCAPKLAAHNPAVKFPNEQGEREELNNHFSLPHDIHGTGAPSKNPEADFRPSTSKVGASGSAADEVKNSSTQRKAAKNAASGIKDALHSSSESE